jgi:ribonuclease P protein component
MKLPRQLTLNERADFQAVREQGKSEAGRYLVLAALAKPDQPNQTGWRYALITSKKSSKAHERNHIRRLIREALIAEGEKIEGAHDLVFIARWRAKEATFHELHREVRKLLKRHDLLGENRAKS